jgi:hypothetical protein
MARKQKRRVKKNPPHQLKSRSNKKSINWTRILVITVGILIALSMLLSLVVTPGTGIAN